MWGFATDYLKNGLMTTLSVPTTLYIGIGTGNADPSYTDTIGEPTDTAYTRFAILSSTGAAPNVNPITWVKVGPGQYENANSVLMSFGTPTASWGWIRSCAAFDAALTAPGAAAGGNPLFVCQLRNPVSVAAGSPPPLILPGQMTLALVDRGAKRAGYTSDYLNDYIMSALMNGQSWSPLSAYLALTQYMLEPAVQPGYLTDVVTPGTKGYARQTFTTVPILAGSTTAVPGLGVSPNSSLLSTAAQLIFGPNTDSAAWPTARAASIWTQSTWSIGSPGKWLYCGRLNPPQTVPPGVPLIIPVGGLQYGWGDER